MKVTIGCINCNFGSFEVDMTELDPDNIRWFPAPPEAPMGWERIDEPMGSASYICSACVRFRNIQKHILHIGDVGRALKSDRLLFGDTDLSMIGDWAEDIKKFVDEELERRNETRRIL